MASNRVFEPGFTFVDLFAGIGGFHLALSEHGGRCVMACEIDDDCRKVYENYFIKRKGETFQFPKDIRALTKKDGTDELLSPDEIDKIVPDHDVLCGGFPCQPFSKGGAQQGILDTTRGTLFQDIIQIVEAKKPKLVFLENVRNLVGPKHRDTWGIIINSLESLGYFVETEPLILSPHQFKREEGGKPQFRERVFILAYREKDFPEAPTARVRIELLKRYGKKLQKEVFVGGWSPNSWSIKDYLETTEHIDQYALSPAENSYLECWNYFVENLSNESGLPSVPIWSYALEREPCISQEMPDWEQNFRIKLSAFYLDHKDFIDDWKKMKWGEGHMTISEFPITRQKLEWQADDVPGSKLKSTNKSRTLRNLLIQLRPSGVRVKLPSYTPALVAMNQTSIIGPGLWSDRSKGRYRRLTPWECCNLQGFPVELFQDLDGYTGYINEEAIYKQLGNAVCVSLIGTIFTQLNSLTIVTKFESINPTLPFV